MRIIRAFAQWSGVKYGGDWPQRQRGFRSWAVTATAPAKTSMADSRVSTPTMRGQHLSSHGREMEPWDGFDGGKSYRYYSWLNRVAAELETIHPDKIVGCPAYRMMNDPLQFRVFPPDVIAQATAYLDEAASTAQEPVVAERIDFLPQDMGSLPRFGRRYWAAHEVEELIAADADLSEVASAMRHMGTLRATYRDRWRCVMRSVDEARR